MITDIEKPKVKTTTACLMAFAPAAFGAGLGLLAGEKMRKGRRRGAGLTMISLGLLASVPFAVDYINRNLIHAPESSREIKRRLQGIRDGGFYEGEDIIPLTRVAEEQKNKKSS